jgi:hypothetical protein
MSIGPLGMIGAAAGSPLAQQKGSDSERVAQDQSTQSREASSAKQAAQAEGIGETEQDHQTSDRDADGRRVWELAQQNAASQDSAEDEQSQQARSRDATGERGNQFDLTG